VKHLHPFIIKIFPVLLILAVAIISFIIILYKAPGKPRPEARVAFVIDDWGYSLNNIDALFQIQRPITLSILPHLRYSKEISEKGAHNQRGEVRLSTRFRKFIWMEDMIELVENSASCDVYSVLKRVDEKAVTEKAFSNPKFVEDIVRDIAEKLNKDDNITWFSVSAENFESIHNHNAYAHITSS